MDDQQHELRPGRRLILTITDNESDKPLLREEHEVVEAARPTGALRGAGTAELDTVMRAQAWSDPELQQLNEAAAPAKALRGGGGAGAVEAGKLGLEVAKFAWEIIKDNKAVVEAGATTTSVLYKGTGGLDYEGARKTKARTYTISVHDSLIKSWELIHAEIACEGTYAASPRSPDVPAGQYLPSVHVYSPKVSADFPCTVKVSATVSEVSNMGRGAIDPMIKVLCAADFGWLLQKRHIVIPYTAQGSRGVVYG